MTDQMINIGGKLEIHFHSQDEASVFLESTSSGRKQIFAEFLIFSAFAFRMMVNLGRSHISQSLADLLEQITPDTLMEILEHEAPDAPRLVDYQGNKGRKGFNATIDYSESTKKYKFVSNSWGLGFLAQGMGYYAPNAVMILLRYLAKKHIDDEAYISSLTVACYNCGYGFKGGQVTITSQNEFAVLSAKSAFSGMEQKQN